MPSGPARAVRPGASWFLRRPHSLARQRRANTITSRARDPTPAWSIRREASGGSLPPFPHIEVTRSAGPRRTRAAPTPAVPHGGMKAASAPEVTRDDKRSTSPPEQSGLEGSINNLHIDQWLLDSFDDHGLAGMAPSLRRPQFAAGPAACAHPSCAVPCI